MNSLYHSYMKNKDTKIRVSTAVGETEEKETGENIGQGTLEGANISAARNEYCNQRNIHTKLEIPKFFGHAVMSQAKVSNWN